MQKERPHESQNYFKVCMKFLQKSIWSLFDFKLLKKISRVRLEKSNATVDVNATLRLMANANLPRDLVCLWGGYAINIMFVDRKCSRKKKSHQN